MSDIYLTPEQKAREKIDAKLNQAGWKVQSKDRIDFSPLVESRAAFGSSDIGRVPAGA